jgi:hypothetical protein
LNDTKTLREQKVQIAADKMELMRDIATYEVNFSSQNPVFLEKVRELKSKIEEARSNLSKKVRFEDGVAYFSDTPN